MPTTRMRSCSSATMAMTPILYHCTGETTIEQMRDAFADAGEPDAVIQTTETSVIPKPLTDEAARKNRHSAETMVTRSASIEVKMA